MNKIPQAYLSIRVKNAEREQERIFPEVLEKDLPDIQRYVKEPVIVHVIDRGGKLVQVGPGIIEDIGGGGGNAEIPEGTVAMTLPQFEALDDITKHRPTKFAVIPHSTLRGNPGTLSEVATPPAIATGVNGGMAVVATISLTELYISRVAIGTWANISNTPINVSGFDMRWVQNSVVTANNRTMVVGKGNSTTAIIRGTDGTRTINWDVPIADLPGVTSFDWQMAAVSTDTDQIYVAVESNHASLGYGTVVFALDGSVPSSATASSNDRLLYANYVFIPNSLGNATEITFDRFSNKIYVVAGVSDGTWDSKQSIYEIAPDLSGYTDLGVAIPVSGGSAFKIIASEDKIFTGDLINNGIYLRMFNKATMALEAEYEPVANELDAMYNQSGRAGLYYEFGRLTAHGTCSNDGQFARYVTFDVQNGAFEHKQYANTEPVNTGIEYSVCRVNYSDGAVHNWVIFSSQRGDRTWMSLVSRVDFVAKAGLSPLTSDITTGETILFPAESKLSGEMVSCYVDGMVIEDDGTEFSQLQTGNPVYINGQKIAGSPPALDPSNYSTWGTALGGSKFVLQKG